MTEQMLPPQSWTLEMLVQFHDYFFPRFDMHDCKFDLFQKDFFINIEDSDKHPKKEITVSYSCRIFASGRPLLQIIPFRLILSAESDWYEESKIGYVEAKNERLFFDSEVEILQAKIWLHIRQSLGLEKYFDKAISDTNKPLLDKKVITLVLDYSGKNRDKYKAPDLVGVKLPIHSLSIWAFEKESRNTPSEKSHA